MVFFFYGEEVVSPNPQPGGQHVPSRVHSTRTYLSMKMEQCVPKRRHIKFRRRGITQKKAYNKGTSLCSLSDTLLKPVRPELPYQQLGCHQHGLQDIKTVKVRCMNSVPVRALSHSSDRLPFCCGVYFASQSA